MYGGGVNRFLLSLVGLSSDQIDEFSFFDRPWQQLSIHLSRHTLESISCASSSRKLSHGIASASWCQESHNVSSQQVSLALNLTVPLFSKARVVLPLRSSDSLYLGSCKISCSGRVETQRSSSCGHGYMSSASCHHGVEGESEVQFVLPAGTFAMYTLAESDMISV